MRPVLTPEAGSLPVSDLPGLGFEFDHAAVVRAAEAFRKA